MGRRLGFLVVCAAVWAALGGTYAHAAFPGQNGKILFSGPTTIHPDGTDRTTLPLFTGFAATWSPDGTKIASEGLGGVQISNADGSEAVQIYETGGVIEAIDWSPDGEQIVFWDHAIEKGGGDTALLIVLDVDGQGGHVLVDPGTVIAMGLSWSPSGDRIAFQGFFGGELGIYTIHPDGTGLQQITDGNRWSPDLSPNAAKLVAERWDGSQTDVVVMNADGSGETQLTESVADDSAPAWSPDGTKIAFHSARAPSGLYTMSADGTNEALLTQPSCCPIDWQPIPINSYPRPKGASPTRVSLVPAYEPCTSPDRTHGPPLAFGSCSSPTQTSSQLTIGAPDANGRPAKSVSYLRVNPLRGALGPPDEADVRLRALITDVRLASDLSDYSGDLDARLEIKITDRDNTPHPGGPGAATVQAFTHSQPISCTATGDTTVGSICELDTTVEALVPGAVKELTRAIWELGAIRVHDGAGNPFMTQGVFVP